MYSTSIILLFASTIVMLAWGISRTLELQFARWEIEQLEDHIIDLGEQPESNRSFRDAIFYPLDPGYISPQIQENLYDHIDTRHWLTFPGAARAQSQAKNSGHAHPSTMESTAERIQRQRTYQISLLQEA
jgi:hypothetical protein